MRAAIIKHHGDIAALEIGDVPAPAPKRGEVVLEVKCAALNHLDIWVRKGRPGLSLQFPHVLGSDAAGIVAEVGEGVTHVKAGDEVVLNPGLACNQCEYCRRGEHSECPDFTIVGLGSSGTFAEHVAVPAQNVYPKPPHLDWVGAAALPLAYLTAWRMLFTRAKMRAGETVLIHGIGGGVALAALQLANLAGGRCIVTSSEASKLERAGALGAWQGINYGDGTPVGQRVLELTNGRGVDIALDAVGAKTWPTNFEAVRKGGRVVHCGVTTGATVECNLAALYWRQISVLGSTMGNHEEFRQLLAAVEAAEVVPVVDKEFPLDQARAAQERMEMGEQFGKIVIEVAA